MTVGNYQDFSKNMQVRNWFKEFGTGLEMLLEEWNQWILMDFIGPLRTKLFARVGTHTEENYVLLKRHPVLCGMMLSRIKACMQHLGLGLVNYLPALPSVLHLYNACLAEGLLESLGKSPSGVY
jgi:hypothetical protein